MATLRRVAVHVGMLSLIAFLSSCHDPIGPTLSTVTGPLHNMVAGRVEHTPNPQVACYSVAPTEPADVTILFGRDLSHPWKTWTQRAQGNGVPLTMYVAGMEASSSYHMHAEVRYPDGAVLEDNDHLFVTGALPKRMRSIAVTVQRFGGSAQQQPGIELLNGSTGQLAQVFATDLDGHILWTYEMPDWQSQHHIRFLRAKQRWMEKIAGWFHHEPPVDELTRTARRQSMASYMEPSKALSSLQIVNPVKRLDNGNFLVLYGVASQGLLIGPLPEGAQSGVREVDLAGHIVREITVTKLNEELHQHGHPEIQLQTFHHEVEVLPNGHWMVLANEFRPGTHPRQGETDIFGDVIVELDDHLEPVWTWSTFDHLDLRRRPLLSPDWTHANAIVYTPDDGDLLFSMRHQSWIIKIDYNHGRGSGKVLWRFGAGGDFKLLNGNDPQDWQYTQHYPFLIGPRSAGVFQMTMMDNGLNRPDANGAPCIMQPGAGKGTPCYSTVPVFEVDEQAKTARILGRRILPVSQFSFWGGSADQLANGNIEAALSTQHDSEGHDIRSTLLEFSPQPELTPIWQMDVQVPPEGGSIYRASRISSLYPGVQW